MPIFLVVILFGLLVTWLFGPAVFNSMVGAVMGLFLGTIIFSLLVLLSPAYFFCVKAFLICTFAGMIIGGISGLNS